MKAFDTINAQQKALIEKQSKTILRLQKQLKDTLQAQKEDEAQLERLEKEVSAAHELLRSYKAKEVKQSRGTVPSPERVSPQKVSPVPK